MRWSPEQFLFGVCAAIGAAGPVASGQEPTVDEEIFEDDLDELLDDGLDELLAGELGELGDEEDDDPLEAWKGFIELRPRVFLRERGGDKNDEQFLIESEFEFEFRLADDVSGYFRPRVFIDAFDGDLDRFEPYEAYVTLESDDYDLRAGQFVENWGIVDTYNPIDIVNRRDFATDFLDADRLGELGVRYRRFLEGGETIGEPALSLYALPVFRDTRFPTENSRYSFDTDDVPFREEEGFEPDGVDRGLYAARYQSTLSTKPFNADVQLLFARGPERFPDVLVEPAVPEATPVYFGARTFGVGLRAVPNQDALGTFASTLTLKAEVVYKDPYRFDGAPTATPDDYLAFVLGVDRAFYGIFSDQDQMTLTVEYAGEEGARDRVSLLRPFRDDLILRAFWEANDFARRSLEVRGIYDFDVQETIFETIYETQLRKLHEDVKLTVQLQLFDPADEGESLFGFFPNNSSLAVGLRWDF